MIHGIQNQRKRSIEEGRGLGLGQHQKAKNLVVSNRYSSFFENTLTLSRGDRVKGGNFLSPYFCDWMLKTRILWDLFLRFGLSLRNLFLR